MTPPIAYREPLDFIHDDHQHKFAEIGISELGFITEQPLKPEIGRFIAKWRHQPAMRKEVKEISLVFGACSQQTVMEAKNLGHVQCLQGIKENDLFFQGATTLHSAIANAGLLIEIEHCDSYEDSDITCTSPMVAQ